MTIKIVPANCIYSARQIDDGVLSIVVLTEKILCAIEYKNWHYMIVET